MSLRADTNSLIDMYGRTKALVSDEVDLLVTMTHDIISTGVGVIGTAYVQSVCASNLDEGMWKHSINEWQATTAEFGAVSYINKMFFSPNKLHYH